MLTTYLSNGVCGDGGEMGVGDGCVYVGMGGRWGPGRGMGMGVGGPTGSVNPRIFMCVYEFLCVFMYFNCFLIVLCVFMCVYVFRYVLFDFNVFYCT